MTEGEDTKDNVTEGELVASMDVPAPFVNKTLLTTMGGLMVRLSFLELRAGASPRARAAVTMHAADFLSLRDTINKVADRVIAQVEFVAEEQEGG